MGLIPFAPGTAGSLFGAAVYYFALARVVEERHLSSFLIYLGMLFGLFIIGVWAATLAETAFGEKDSRHIVIDEIVGYLVAMFALPPELFYIISSFVLFRILDILNPPPISHLQSLKGGLGVMLDDVAAGFAICLFLHLVALIRGLF